MSHLPLAVSAVPRRDQASLPAATSPGQFLERVKAGDVPGATVVVLRLRDLGASLEEIIDQVLCPAQHTAGDLWAQGRWSPRDEQRATTVVTSCLLTLARTTPSPGGGTPADAAPARAGHVVVACAEGERHGLAAQMVAALAHRHVPRVTRLGPRVDRAGLERVLARGDVDVLALSCTLPSNLLGLARWVQVAHGFGVPVIAGGRALGTDGARAATLGADAWARHASALAGPVPALANRHVHLPAAALAVESLSRAELERARHEVAGAFPRVHDHALRTASLQNLRLLARSAAASMVTGDSTILDEQLAWLTGFQGASPVVAAACARSLATVVEPVSGTAATELSESARRLDERVGRVGAQAPRSAPPRSLATPTTGPVEPHRELLAWLATFTSLAVAVTDEAGRITSWSPAMEELMGTAVAPRTDQDLAALGLCHEDGTPMRWEDTPLLRARRGRTVRDQTLRLAGHDGLVRYLRCQATPLTGHSGAVRGAVCFVHDVTTEHEARQRDADLRDRLVATVNHHLRTPLSVASGHLELLLESDLPPAARRSAEVLQRATDRLKQLVLEVSELVDLEETASVHRAYGDLVPVLARLAADHQHTALERDLRLVVDVPPQVLLSVDLSRVTKAVDALLDNALRYAPSGSTVVLAVDERPDAVAVEVRDEGRGIPAADRERVLAPFETVEHPRRAVDSRGLGLATAHAVASAHGGSLQLLDATPHGLVARLTLSRSASTVGRAWFRALGTIPLPAAVDMTGSPAGRPSDGQDESPGPEDQGSRGGGRFKTAGGRTV